MSLDSLVVNGHFKKQQITGVQRYALELLKEFDRLGVGYSTVEPPGYIFSDNLRQLWMQAVMPFKVPKNKILWSPTNIGPVMCENQVLTLHDIADQLYPGWFDAKYVNWRKFILPKLLRRVKGIITVSEFSKQTILEKYPMAEGKVNVIYNGVNTEHFYQRNSDEISDVKERYNLEKPFIITVGSLDPRKNINGLIKAWNLLPSTIRGNLDLVIAGGTADKFLFHLEEEIDSTVHFLGYVDYNLLPALYSGALIFIYPSLFEGFGLPVLEAMACGTPVITSNTTALKEVTGNAAKVVNPASIEEIKSAILSLIESSTQRSKMISEGIVWSSQFTWKRSADQTYDCLSNAL